MNKILRISVFMLLTLVLTVLKLEKRIMGLETLRPQMESIPLKEKWAFGKVTPRTFC